MPHRLTEHTQAEKEERRQANFALSRREDDWARIVAQKEAEAGKGSS